MASGSHPKRSRWLLGPLALMAPPLLAQPLPVDPLERQCWLAHTTQRAAVDLREPVSVHFSNLKTGWRVRTPFWVEFGVRGMGVIPAGNANDKAGHHHILIDTPLPRDHTAPIPFSATHKHFGKGQTGTELDLPPGRHTLRLLFADHAHKPYFVFSNEITIEVTGKRGDPDPRVVAGDADSCETWYQDQRTTPRVAAERTAYVKNLRDDEAVPSPFTVSLGVLGAGLGVAPAGTSIKDTGHFRLTVLQKGQVVQRQNLVDGRTEAIVDLPVGDYELQFALHDGAGNALFKGGTLKFSVNRHDR